MKAHTLEALLKEMNLPRMEMDELERDLIDNESVSYTKAKRDEMQAKILGAIESSKIDLARPWSLPRMPRNINTNRRYEGRNIFRLWADTPKGTLDPRWGTVYDINEVDITYDIKGQTAASRIVHYCNSREEYRALFNGSQIGGLKTYDASDRLKLKARKCDRIIKRSGLTVYSEGDQVTLHQKKGILFVPARSRFANDSHYYATVLGELTSWVITESFNSACKKYFTIDHIDYVGVAKRMASACVMSEYGISIDDDLMSDRVEKGRQYMRGIVDKLRKGPRHLQSAMTLASKVAGYIIGLGEDLYQ